MTEPGAPPLPWRVARHVLCRHYMGDRWSIRGQPAWMLRAIAALREAGWSVRTKRDDEEALMERTKRGCCEAGWIYITVRPPVPR